MLAYITYILSAWFSPLDRADIFFLPCPFKYITGFDCPGCGFQRSFMALLKGNWQESLHLYPPTIPLLATFIMVWPVNHFTKTDNAMLIKVLYLVTGSIVLGNYMFKLFIL